MCGFVGARVEEPWFKSDRGGVVFEFFFVNFDDSVLNLVEFQILFV